MHQLYLYPFLYCNKHIFILQQMQQHSVMVSTMVSHTISQILLFKTCDASEYGLSSESLRQLYVKWR